jgi:LysR family transcriptional activator of glutamate synthase operon
MRIEWLESFLITAKTKSLTKASEQLHMSQPALSKQMKKLEENLGASLFIRSATGVELTEAGQILFREIEPVLHKVHAIRKEILFTKGISDIRIATWPSIASEYLPARLAAAKSNHDYRDISVKVSYSFHEILRYFQNSEIDAALLDERGIQHPYWSKQLFTEPFYLFVNHLHPLAQNRDQIYFDELKDEPLVVLPPSCDVRTLLEKAYNMHNASLQISAELDFGQSIIGFISANLGVSILPEIFTHNIDRSKVKAIPITDFKVRRHISLIARNPDIGNLLFTLFFSTYSQ